MKSIHFTSIFLLLSSLNSLAELKHGIAPHGTHFPVLATIVANTQGPILEMGCGDYSTPMLQHYARPRKDYWFQLMQILDGFYYS